MKTRMNHGGLLLALGLALGLAIAVQACSSDGTVDATNESTDAPSTTSTSADQTTTTAAPTTSTTEEPETTTSTAAPIEQVAFADDFGTSVAPILTENCARCHNPGGPGSVHWSLETAADAASAAPRIQSFVESGVMPPWPAGPLSISFSDDRGLRDDQRAAILDWVDGGAQLDIDGAMPLPADNGILALSEVDTTVLPPEPYAGSTAKTDDYRCQVYDPQLTEPGWLTGYNFIPDKSEVVHHAIGYLITDDERPTVERRSAEDPASGWECFGGSGLGNDQLFIGWAPGQGPTEYSDGAGLFMDVGDFIVIQIHYHYEDDAPPDSSALEMNFTDADEPLDQVDIVEFFAPVEIPCSSDESGPLCDRDAAMARAIERYGGEGVQANFFNSACGVTPEDFAHLTDGVVSSTCDLPMRESGEIISILGHEHEIGASFRMTLNPDTADERILLDIPKWDFDWQYNYYPTETIEVQANDNVRVECSWDRSLRRADLEPAYVLWADGTNDEMCFATIVIRDT